MKLTVRDAAAMLGVAETAIYRWIDDDEIPYVMIHHRPTFHRVELLEWAIERELPVGVDLYGGSEEQPFSRALERGGARVFDGDLRALVAELPLHGCDREAARAILAARGADLFITRPAAWIAIPRARSPIIRAEAAAMVLLMRAEPHALVLDGIPTKAIFVIIAPTVKQHLQLLSRLSLALHDEALRRAATRDDFGQVLAEARRWEQRREPERVPQ